MKKPVRVASSRPRREIRYDNRGFSSGLDLTVTRKGVEVSGFYDSFVGLEGFTLTWDELLEAKRRVDSKEPLGHEEAGR